MIRINTDAAVNDVKKTAGMGIVINSNKLYEQLSVPVDYETVHNNHTLEFKTLIYALNWLKTEQLTEEMVFIETDSQVVVQVIENEHTKNELYQPFLDDYLNVKDNFPFISIQWIPEKNNKGADNLAKQALMKRLS